MVRGGFHLIRFVRDNEKQQSQEKRSRVLPFLLPCCSSRVTNIVSQAAHSSRVDKQKHPKKCEPKPHKKVKATPTVIAMFLPSSLLQIATGVLVGVAALGLCVVSVASSKWKNDTNRDVQALMKDIETHATEAKKKVPHWNDLPSPVVRYLQSALILDHNDSVSIPMIQSLSMTQSGTFLLNGQWIPFTAKQVFSAVCPGFVWDAHMHIPLPLALGSCGIRVRDAYVAGRGTMVAKIWGFLPMVHQHDTPMLNEGELSRWFGECMVMPTAFLGLSNTTSPNHNQEFVLQWKNKATTPTSATAVLVDFRTNSSTTVQTEITFTMDEATGLVKSISALRPYCPPGGSQDVAMLLPWQGNFLEYQNRGGILVPIRMEVGWWKQNAEGKQFLELYFRGHNHSFDFDFTE